MEQPFSHNPRPKCETIGGFRTGLKYCCVDLKYCCVVIIRFYAFIVKDLQDALKTKPKYP